MTFEARCCSLGFVALLGTSALVGCDQALLSASARANESEAGTRPERSLLERQRFDAALGALEKAVGPSRQVLAFEARREALSIQVLSVMNKEQVVEFRFRNGKLSGPEPVELRGTGSLSHNLFPLELERLEVIPELVATAVEHIDAEHGKAERVLLRRNLPESTDVRYRVYVQSPLWSGQFDADERGEPLEG